MNRAARHGDLRNITIVVIAKCIGLSAGHGDAFQYIGIVIGILELGPLGVLQADQPVHVIIGIVDALDTLTHTAQTPGRIIAVVD